MRIKLSASILFTCITGLLTIQHAFSQISDVDYPATACTGEPFTVTFTIAPAAEATTYTVRLVPATGAALTLATTTTGSASVTIPGTVAPAANYKIRVVSAAPSDSITGAANLAVSLTPAKPVVTNLPAACVGDEITSTAVAAAVTSGSNLKWYETSDVSGPGSDDPIVPATLPAGTTSFYVVSTNGTCKSEASVISITTVAQPTPPTTEALSVCAGTTITAAAMIAQVSGAGGLDLVWYTSENPAETGTANPTPPSAATAGSHSFYVAKRNGNCESDRVLLEVEVTAAPAVPTLISALTAICQNTEVEDETFTSAITAGPGTLQWYASASGGSPLTDGNITVNTSTAGEKSLYVSRKVGDCESARLKVSIMVNDIPSAPTVVTPVTACEGVDPAPVLSATGSGLQWYNQGGTLLASKPVISTDEAGTTTYQVSQTINNCESPKATITVQINPVPAAPVIATLPAAVCVGAVVPSSAFTNAITAGAGTLVWYSAATGGSALTGAGITVSTTTAGIKSLYVARLQTGCESARTKVDIEVKANPAAPTVSPLSICAGDDAPVLTATGEDLKWYTSGGATLTSAPTIPTAAAATFSYRVSQTVNGCESPKATINATVYKTAAPAVTSSIAYCKGATPAALTATGTALKWYTTASGGTGVTPAPTVSTATVGTVAYYVTQTLNGCESDRSRIDVRTKEVPVAPTVASLPDVCQNTTVTSAQLLSGVTDASGTLKWYTVATGGSGTGTAPAPTTTTSGVKNFYVTQTVEACESTRASISLDVKSLPAAPSVTATADLCHQATTATPLTATPSGDNTLTWYSVATGGSALTGAPTPSTATVQTTSYYVSQSQEYSSTLSCEGPRARINVVVNPLPVAANSTDQVVCQTRTAQTLNYAATVSASSNSLVWFPNATSETIETTTPSRNLTTPGEFEYYVSQRSNKQCVGPRKVVKIRVKRLPALPTVANLEYCQFENAPALTAGLETNATPNWYGRSATGGSASSSAPVPSTEEGGNFSYYVSQTLEACEGDRAELKVLVKTTPKPQTQTTISYCHNADATPLTATGQRLAWYRPNGEKRSEPYTPFTASVGDQFFYVTQTGDNNCESPKEEIKITVYPLPSATISGQSSIPLGGSASIQISFTGLGPWTYKLSNGFTGTSESNNVSLQVQPSFTTSYLVTEVSNACGNGIPNGSAVITVLRPTITTGNPNTLTICAGAEIAVPFQQSGTFPTGSKFVLQLSQDEDDDTFKSIESTVSGNSINAIIPDTLSGGSYFVRVISENPNPDLSTAGSISGVEITVDPKPTATLPEDRTILAGQSTSLSITLTGAAPWTFSYSNGESSNSITTSTSPYLLTVTPDATTTYTITSVDNRCGTGRSSGETRVQVDPILGVEPTFSDWVKVLPTVVNDRCNVSLDVTAYDGINLKVVDLSGRVLKDIPLRAEVTEIDLSSSPSGIYLFRVTKDRRHAVIKVLKP